MLKKRVSIIVVAVLLCFSINAFAALYGYNELVEVEKSSTNTVYSLSTGTNTFNVAYGGTNTSSIRSMSATVQYYLNSSYHDYPGSSHTLSAGETDDWRIIASPYKMFRLKLSGAGTGSGWIQGLE